jgi:hypothetical protein
MTREALNFGGYVKLSFASSHYIFPLERLQFLAVVPNVFTCVYSSRLHDGLEMPLFRVLHNVALHRCHR